MDTEPLDVPAVRVAPFGGIDPEVGGFVHETLARRRVLEPVPLEAAPAQLRLRLRRVTIDGGQVGAEADGSRTIVVAGRDPGHPNRVATQGHPEGRIWLRWFHPSATPERPTTEVVDLDAVSRGPARA